MSLIALVADDHALFRAGLAQLLRLQCGFSEVVEAQTLDDALEILGVLSGSISLAVFDLSMPGMSSAASLQIVCDNYRDTRIVVMTGSKVRRDIFIALEAGIHGFILKNAGPDKILAAIRYVLDGNIYVPPEIVSTKPLEDNNVPSVTNPLDKLTPRQRQILEHMSCGTKSNKDIARQLDLTENTVKVHVVAVFKALGIHDRRHIPAALKALAIRERAEAP